MAGKYRSPHQTSDDQLQVNVTFRVPLAQRKAIQQMADYRHMSMSAVITDFLNRFWDEFENHMEAEVEAKYNNWGILPTDYQPPVKPTNDPELNNSLEWVAKQRGQSLAEFMEQLASSNVHKWIAAVQNESTTDRSSDAAQ